MSSRIDEAGHTKAFDYPGAEHDPSDYLPSGWFSCIFYFKNPKSIKMWDYIVINLLVSFRDLTGAVFTLSNPI